MNSLAVLFLFLNTLAPNIAELQVEIDAGRFQSTHSFTHVYDDALLVSGAVTSWTDWFVGAETRVGYMRLAASELPGVPDAEKPETTMDVLPVSQNWLFRLRVAKMAHIFVGAGVSWWFAREKLKWCDPLLATYEDASWRDDSFGWQWLLGIQWRGLSARATWWESWFDVRPLHTYHASGDLFQLNGWSLAIGWSFDIPHID